MLFQGRYRTRECANLRNLLFFNMLMDDALLRASLIKPLEFQDFALGGVEMCTLPSDIAGCRTQPGRRNDRDHMSVAGN